MNSKITIILAAWLLGAATSHQAFAADECTPLDVAAPAYPVDPQTNAFDAAKQAAKFAQQSGDKAQAAQIAAEVALQIDAGTADIALIISEIAQALHLSTGEINQMVADVATMTCTNAWEITNLVRRTLEAFQQGKRPPSFQDDVEPVQSDNPNITGPGRPVSPN